MKTTNKAAYLRGQRFAIQWKQLVRTLRQWDNFWVHAARKRHLPAWTGRLPLAIGLTGIAVCALFSITVVLGCLAFIWAVAYILQHANGKVGNSSEYKRDSQYVSGVQLRNGNQGYGYYYGFIRVDDEQK
ncbi:hypothetical protein Q9K76_004688 [Escherichia coli]|uniref:hypothetical protein n=1 Tax=Escherichia coli TaxID=562 RepID=UPI001302640A|nr:hypothetical protein [Escherichia coli]KAE9699617.1 hypothetical protein GP721_24000 [Enterobacteriaceae bacterium TzEc077]ELH6542719.1 hypothetical protein [Escherichia coli]ELH6553076.1 hypothetical protein [Escherichia coli]ELH6566815.1 hypothetical protein [Escherichia coli]ELH6581191.1 hypothetical protein [Escherichia coli]